jgi:hypothetical protein
MGSRRPPRRQGPNHIRSRSALEAGCSEYRACGTPAPLQRLGVEPGKYSVKDTQLLPVETSCKATFAQANLGLNCLHS